MLNRGQLNSFKGPRPLHSTARRNPNIGWLFGNPTATAKSVLGEDYWSYGVAHARHTRETFVRHQHVQRLSARPMEVGKLFYPST